MVTANQLAAATTATTKLYERYIADEIAGEVRAILLPISKRVLIVGSLRREMKYVKDIDILVQPAVEELTVQAAMFYNEQRSFEVVNMTMRELSRNGKIGS